MDLVEIIELRKVKVAEMESLINTSKEEVRKLNEEEENTIVKIQSEIESLDLRLNEKNNKNTDKKMEKFSELIVRNGDKVENFSTRALVLASDIDNVTVAGNTSVVGYEPFYKQMGVEIIPNLKGSIKLPYMTAITAGKNVEGARTDNSNTPSVIELSPKRYTITETLGKEILSVGNEAALQSFLFEMVKSVDRAITKDIFTVVCAGATALTGVTSYTTNLIDGLVAQVDGDVTLLMPRTEFYKAKGVKIDTGSGLFLANKSGQFAGNLWDGTPLFYSNLFVNGVTIAAVDLKHVTVAEFGNDIEVIFDQYSKAPEGQVVVTVCKLADVALRNTLAAKKAAVA